MRRSANEDEIYKLRILADFLFGYGAGDALLKGNNIEVELSRTTGKIRHVYVDGTRIMTIRAHDGMISLSIEGAERLRRRFKPPKLRVIVRSDVVDFIRRGRDVFAKHVIDADRDIRPGMEVLVVDQNDELLAVGRAVLSGEEMILLNRGVAVRVRRGINEKDKSKTAEKND
ncbi:MAG: pseudouridine synthase [Thermoprotei archaeon]|nr:MAG: pseudouridine synthase [Thermoprotei archaeon]RLF20379.1 MAG: pseudouridine synthase [Thermoprotei archaeon]